MGKVGFPALLIGIAGSVCLGWKYSLPRKFPELPSWRRRLLLLGLVGNVASLIGVLILVLHAVWLPKVAADIANYRVFVILAGVTTLLGAFGKRIPRLLVILNGLALTFLWLEIGASSL